VNSLNRLVFTTVKPVLKFAMQWLWRAVAAKDPVSVAIFLIAACARITWATGRFYSNK
jgi:hypothetical protein